MDHNRVRSIHRECQEQLTRHWSNQSFQQSSCSGEPRSGKIDRMRKGGKAKIKDSKYNIRLRNISNVISQSSQLSFCSFDSIFLPSFSLLFPFLSSSLLMLVPSFGTEFGFTSNQFPLRVVHWNSGLYSTSKATKQYQNTTGNVINQCSAQETLSFNKTFQEGDP